MLFAIIAVGVVAVGVIAVIGNALIQESFEFMYE